MEPITIGLLLTAALYVSIASTTATTLGQGASDMLTESLLNRPLITLNAKHITGLAIAYYFLKQTKA